MDALRRASWMLGGRMERSHGARRSRSCHDAGQGGRNVTERRALSPMRDLLPAGAYTLSVALRGQQVYRSDLVLNDNAALHVAIITDSIIFRNLQTVEVTALKHLLGPLQIVSKKDTRLWDFCYRGTPWELEPDGNAAVATPNTLHPLYGDNPCSEGEMGCCRPNKYYSQSFGLEVSSLNSVMKNELLREGRIRDVLYPAPADTTKTD